MHSPHHQCGRAHSETCSGKTRPTRRAPHRRSQPPHTHTHTHPEVRKQACLPGTARGQARAQHRARREHISHHIPLCLTGRAGAAPLTHLGGLPPGTTGESFHNCTYNQKPTIRHITAPVNRATSNREHQCAQPRAPACVWTHCVAYQCSPPPQASPFVPSAASSRTKPAPGPRRCVPQRIPAALGAGRPSKTCMRPAACHHTLSTRRGPGVEALCISEPQPNPAETHAGTPLPLSPTQTHHTTIPVHGQSLCVKKCAAAQLLRTKPRSHKKCNHMHSR